MADNSNALRRSRRKDSRAKRQQSLDAIEAITASAEPISFPAVAQRAGVSVSFLYAQRELAERIAEARDRQRQAGRDRAWQLPARSLVTEQSLRVELANAKDQVRRLTEQIAVLHQRVERQLGAEADAARGLTLAPALDELEQRAGELEAQNHQHRQHIARLEAEGRELAETLEAARAMNREMMSELNRRPPTKQKARRSFSAGDR